MTAKSAVFGDYASHYDLLYRDKDYAAEVARILHLIDLPAAGLRLLELGSGTGGHALELARRGCVVSGVDMSEAMCARAEARRRALEPALAARLSFLCADARGCRLTGDFDAVLSLFHVLSYQTRDADVDALLATAAAHLRPGARFLFDFWHGPAVQASPPEVRVKKVENLERTAVPTLHPERNVVEVEYTLRAGGETLREAHAMRYFFMPEIEAALARAGLRLEKTCELLTGAPLGPQVFSAFAVAVRA